MKDFIIATVSTADLREEWLKEHHIPFLPYNFILNGEGYQDDCREETKQMIFKAMRDGSMPSTSQISEYAYEHFFTKVMEKGKDVIFLDMSRSISSSINNAKEAIMRTATRYPGQRLTFVDSYCISAGLALLVMKLVEMKENGSSYEEVIDFAENNKRKVIHRFLADDLQWLRKGGRLSNASAIVGTLLSIKPLMYVRNDGSIYAYDKVRGRKKSIHTLVESMKDDFDSAYSGDKVLVYHADAEEEAKDLADLIRETYPSVKDIEISTEGPVIGSHVGPGFLAVVYFGTKRIL